MGSSGEFCQVTSRGLALPGSSRPSNLQPPGDTNDNLLPLIFEPVSIQGLEDREYCIIIIIAPCSLVVQLLAIGDIFQVY